MNPPFAAAFDIGNHPREWLRDISRRTVAALDVRDWLGKWVWRAVAANLHIGDWQRPLASLADVRVVAVGKAAVAMAHTIDDVFGPGVVRGIIVTNATPNTVRANLPVIVAGHPVPNAESLRAADAVFEVLRGASESTLVLFLISGGGSALLERPLWADVSLADLATVHRLLVTGGANVVAMNAVRKHLSAVKGGRLAVAAQPAEQVTLFVSDVPENFPSAVASGPTMPDETTLASVHRILDEFGFRDRLPLTIRRHFDAADVPETPKPGDAAFARSRFVRVLGNPDAVGILAGIVRDMGLPVAADVSVDDWPIADAVAHLLHTLRATPERPAALVTGGELSCPVRGDGMGGRNQEFALRVAREISGERIAVMSVGTDGIDGNSPAAGAIADGSTLSRAASLGLDATAALARSDAFSFFTVLGDALLTGPTGTNVRDVRLLLAW